MKKKLYKVLLTPAMMCGFETVALTKKQEAEFEVAKMKMMGITSLKKNKNEVIHGTVHVRQSHDKGVKTEMVWSCTETKQLGR